MSGRCVVLPAALRLGALVLAAGVAVAAWVLAASLTDGLITLAVIALLAFLLTGRMLLRAIARRSGRPHGARDLAWLVAGGVAYAAVAQVLVGAVPGRVPDEAVAPPDIAYWTLPDGARIAWVHEAASGDRRAEPIVFLHDGPGIPALSALAAAGERPLDFAAAEGYDVYYYDQRGAGFSSRLDLRRQAPYTVRGHVEDLEAIRAALGAERVILAGHGWGATLAINYLLAHPERVDRLMLLAPAPLWFPALADFVEPAARAKITQPQAAALALLQRPTMRLTIGRLTALTSRRAAHTLIRDWEADQWWTAVTRESMRLGQPNMTCRSDPARGLPPLEGLGFFAYSYTTDDALKLPDPRPALRALDTPALILRGLCDHVRWQVAYEYLDVLPEAAFVALPASGHLLWLEQAGLQQTAIRAFLHGETLPLAFYHPSPARSER